MGKVHSLFGMSGKIGDYVFYELNGQQIMRKKPTKKKGPKTQAQKEVLLQNTEFGRASTAGKTLRLALSEECNRFHDPYLYQRVSRLMLHIKSCDPAPVGLRTVSGGLGTDAGQELFARFHFQKKQKDFPHLRDTHFEKGQLHFDLSLPTNHPFTLIELQINFEKSLFRRAEQVITDAKNNEILIVKKALRAKKGFVDFLMISGDGFLQGVVVVRDCVD